MKLAFLLAAAGASLLVTTAASAAKRTFTADLSPDQENVAPDLGGATPSGELKVTFDDQTKELCGELKFTGLTGIATGVHIHRAPPGQPEADGLPTEKFEIPPKASPMQFNIKLPANFETSLDDGELYANIHTAKNTKGEIRSVSPWIEDNDLQPVTCPAPTTPPTDAGAPKDGGSTSSSSSSSGATSSTSGTASSSGATTGDDDDDSESSSGAATSGSAKGTDAGATKPKKDEGGCNTTGDTGPLSFAMVLGVGIAALTRARRKKR